MYTVKYYGNEQTADNAADAILAAKQMVKLYGQGNTPPVFVVDTDAEADEMVRMMEVARESYSVRVGSVPAI